MSSAPGPTGSPAYKRVLLKLSGESFCRPGEGGINVDEVSKIARQAFRVASRGVELAIVVGGGNILRGASLSPAETSSKRPPRITWAWLQPSSTA